MSTTTAAPDRQARITVTLPPDLARRLGDLARSQHRDARQQAVLILERVLSEPIIEKTVLERSSWQ